MNIIIWSLVLSQSAMLKVTKDNYKLNSPVYLEPSNMDHSPVCYPLVELDLYLKFALTWWQNMIP